MPVDLSALADGTISATATATDAAGDVSADSGIQTALKDTIGRSLDTVAGANLSSVLTLTFSEPVRCSSLTLEAFVVTVNGVLPDVFLGLSGCGGTSSTTVTLTGGLLLHRRYAPRCRLRQLGNAGSLRGTDRMCLPAPVAVRVRG